MFITIATVRKIEYDAVTDSFWIQAEVVLSEPTGHLQINAKELDASWHADRLENKEPGAHVIAINGPGRPRYEVGDELEAIGFPKEEPTKVGGRGDG
jgi:hypothetical protein